jgi:hypothetical protein
MLLEWGRLKPKRSGTFRSFEAAFRDNLDRYYSAQWKCGCISHGMRTLAAKFMIATLVVAPLSFTAAAQDAKQDMKAAGRDTKAAAKNTGRGVSHAAKTTKRKAKQTVHKGASKVANKTDGK